MLAMNLLTTGNLSSIDPYALETWTNPEMIAVDQDVLGFPAILLENTAINATEVRPFKCMFMIVHAGACCGEHSSHVFGLPAAFLLVVVPT